MALVVLVVAACASVSTPGPIAVGNQTVQAAQTAPWLLPASEEGRQSLFRIQYGGQRGEGVLRAALRLASPSRYEIAATDPLGRQLWTLSVTPGAAVWLDHRGRRVCPVGEEIQIPDLGLPPLPLAAVPALLLGRLPLVPGTGVATAPEDGGAENGELREGDRRWSWRREGDQLSGWTLYQHGAPVLWWRRDGDGGILSARRQGAQLRWQRVLSEPLASSPDQAPTPADYQTGQCDGITVP